MRLLRFAQALREPGWFIRLSASHPVRGAVCVRTEVVPRKSVPFRPWMKGDFVCWEKTSKPGRFGSVLAPYAC